MITKRIEDALNKQLNNEMFSAYLYMEMANHCEYTGLKGIAHWFHIQYHEEMFHAMKIRNYLYQHGCCVKLTAISEPEHDFKSPLDMFEKTLKHELFITKSINDLLELAKEEKDNATQIFLHWYVTEQVEEEENDNDIISQLKMIKDNIPALIQLDRQLALRTTTVPLNYAQPLTVTAP